MLTKPWVWNSPFFGLAVRLGDFYPFDTNVEHVSGRLKKKVDEGYFVQIFPEGTRSKTGELGRFHKGAYFLAESLGLDILPIYFHGTGGFLRKGDFWGRENWVTCKIGERIKPNDSKWGEGYSKRGKAISKFYKQEYAQLCESCETPFYFKRKLRENYHMKGWKLKLYIHYKLITKDNYSRQHELLPKQGLVYDLGSGYGFMVLMLNKLSKHRKLIGIDQEEDKVLIAQNTNTCNENTVFVQANVMEFEFEEANGFVIDGILSWLSEEQQVLLTEKAIAALKPGGVILIGHQQKNGFVNSLGKMLLRDARGGDQQRIEKDRIVKTATSMGAGIQLESDMIIIQKPNG